MKQKKYQLQQVGTSGSYSRYALVAEGVSRVTDSTTIEQQYGKDTSFLGSGEVGTPPRASWRLQTASSSSM